MARPLQFRFALFGERIVDAHSLTEDDRRDHSCLSCSRVLRPAIGRKNRPHFRHVKGVLQNNDCGLETYLHKAGKALFKQEFENCRELSKPFDVLFPTAGRLCNHCREHGPCAISSTLTTTDIASTYSAANIESRFGEFTADIELTSKSGERAFVEIVVAHRSSAKKVASGVPIVEIRLKREVDLDLIRSHRLSTKDKRVSVFNFAAAPRGEDLRAECETDIVFMSADREGKCLVRRRKAHEFEEIERSHVGPISITEKYNTGIHIEFVRGLLAAGIPIRDCHLCSKHLLSNSEQNLRMSDTIFCRYSGRTCSPDAAADCPEFSPINRSPSP